ncbi:DUF6888 family protein [Synechocystis sp. PCC 7509]|uniref:DUF6888 family protein n=1 Tax=Synechocystis sp. PCC 7509 TaxID=927677 RepID=UPI0002ACC5C9|nr:hypothetical protein [Synechocystis sp. PCC 7509]
MIKPTSVQLQRLYDQCYRITNIFLQPIHLVRIDDRTGNLYILAGVEESIEVEIDPQGDFVT